MPSLVRNILALLAGIVTGVVCITAVEAINGSLYPLPPGFDPRNAEMIRQYVATLPPQAFVVVLLGYLVGFPLAVFLATRLSSTKPMRQGVLVAAFFGAASIMNLRAYPHPVWFWCANFSILFFAVWSGIRTGLARVRVSPPADKA